MKLFEICVSAGIILLLILTVGFVVRNIIKDSKLKKKDGSKDKEE